MIKTTEILSANQRITS